MGIIPPSPNTAANLARERDTGFPEPFCGNRNTTRPHPDANLSPDACISANDVSVSQTMHRSRRSFLGGGNKYKRTISHGLLTAPPPPSQQQHHMYNDNAILDSDADSPIFVATPVMATRVAPTSSLYGGRPSKDSYDEDRSSSSAHGESSLAKDHRLLASSSAVPSSPSSSTSSRKRTVLRRLRWYHRD